MDKKKRSLTKTYKSERDALKRTVRKQKEKIEAYGKVLKWYSEAAGIYCNERASKILKEWK